MGLVGLTLGLCGVFISSTSPSLFISYLGFKSTCDITLIDESSGIVSLTSAFDLLYLF